jgi:hypothetical protein
MTAQEPMTATMNQMMPLSGQPNRFSFHMETSDRATRITARNTISRRLKALNVSFLIPVFMIHPISMPRFRSSPCHDFPHSHFARQRPRSLSHLATACAMVKWSWCSSTNSWKRRRRRWSLPATSILLHRQHESFFSLADVLLEQFLNDTSIRRVH